MQLGRTIPRGEQSNSLRILRGLLLVAAITSAPRLWLEQDIFVTAPAPGRGKTAVREAYASANELYDFKLPAFQQWLRENHPLRQPSEGDTDFSRRVFLARTPKSHDECHRQMRPVAGVSRPA